MSSPVSGEGIDNATMETVIEFRGHHTYFGEMPCRQVPGLCSMGARIHFCQPSGPGPQASARIPGRQGRRERVT